jgi:hypothetical protein
VKTTLAIPIVAIKIIPYTFKALHGLGSKVVMELVHWIMGGLDVDGWPILGSLPKVLLGSKPKSIVGMTSKQWCERKKHKMNIAREEVKKAYVRTWDTKTKDIYVAIWRQLKFRHGILRAHMDELLHRGGGETVFGQTHPVGGESSNRKSSCFR